MPAAPLGDRREAAPPERGHGRTHDRRHLVAHTDLSHSLDWPGVAPVLRRERTWRERARERRQVHYGLTSLPPAVADPARLLALRRGHWQIENGLHYTEDVVLGEDASLLRRAGHRRIARQLRAHADHPTATVALVVEPPPARA